MVELRLIENDGIKSTALGIFEDSAQKVCNLTGIFPKRSTSPMMAKASPNWKLSTPEGGPK